MPAIGVLYIARVFFSKIFENVGIPYVFVGLSRLKSRPKHYQKAGQVGRSN